ncbi:hypothetical protein, partial [Streptomyces sp. NPDC127039]|uniref:hypothetical protein n=1 Tax=Streptomyces sp. NPDC127039 TaxID=3347115 RepID=UPI003656A863
MCVRVDRTRRHRRGGGRRERLLAHLSALPQADTDTDTNADAPTGPRTDAAPARAHSSARPEAAPAEATGAGARTTAASRPAAGAAAA